MSGIAGSGISWEGSFGGGATSGVPGMLLLNSPAYAYEAFNGTTALAYPDSWTLFTIDPNLILVYGIVSRSRLMLTMDGVNSAGERDIWGSPLFFAAEIRGFKIKALTPAFASYSVLAMKAD